MAQTLMQHAFHSGEWAPALNARVDLLKYHSAAALMRNYFVDYRGGASSRPGLKYCLQTYRNASVARLIPFQITPTVGYILEFGDQYIRFYFQGVPVVDTALAITGISKATPTVVTVANTLAVDAWVYISGVLGMTEINNRFFRISARTAANITLERLNGTATDSTAYSTWTSGGTVQRIYTIATPYTAAELVDIKYTQEENKLYLFHPSHVPQVLTFVAAANWTIGAITFGTTISPPTALAFTTTLAAGAASYSYIVTSVGSDGEESLEAGINMIGYQDFRAVASSMNLSWTAASGAVSYNVYRAPIAYNPVTFNGVPHGYIGNATGTSFIDGNLAADYAQTPPTGVNPIIFNPTVGLVYNQRLYMAAPPTKPNAFFASKPKDSYNFTYSSPLQPGDAIVAALSSSQQLSIHSMVGMPSGLLFFTDKVVQQVNNGTPGAAATAIDAEAQPQSYVGANKTMAPIVANFNILFVQQKNSIVRDITYNFNANIYTGVDISILSSHLFFGYSLTDWAYAEEPFKLIWTVRNDGTLLSLTYLKEQELIGWAHSDTDGLFESVATITEAISSTRIVDATYVIVNKSGTRRIMRMDDRFWTSLLDCWTVDNALRYSGAPATVIRGLDQLASQNAYGLTDGVPFGPIAVTADGVLTMPVASSNVLAGGTPFRPQLQTLALELGEPTVQGKRKSISAVTVRVKDTLGLSIGSTLANAVPMKGLIVGNLNEAMNAAVTGLVTADARTVIDPGWTVPGQYFIDQPNPYPSTILGVIPEFTLGDGGKQG